MRTPKNTSLLDIAKSLGTGVLPEAGPSGGGGTGWTPTLAVATDGDRRVLQVTGWTGGTGTAPASGMYVGAAGIVTAIGDAVDIRGAAGSGGSGGGGGWSPPANPTKGALLAYDGAAWALLPPPATRMGLAWDPTSGMPSWTAIVAATSNMSEVQTWLDRVSAIGGQLGPNSQALATALILALESRPYDTKIKWLLPLLGSNLMAATVPLRDHIGVGACTNMGFVNADFTEATGLQGNGTNKYLRSMIHPADLGATNNGGLGYYELAAAGLGGNSEVVGCYDNGGNNRYAIDLRATVCFASWGGPGNAPNLGSSGKANAHYYLQRSDAALRQFWINAALGGQNTTGDGGSGSGDRTILIVGCDEGSAIAPANSRCGVAYMTDGTLTSDEIADFDALLRTYLLSPTGRI